MVNGKTMISLASSLKTTAQPSAQPAKGAAAEVSGAAQAFPEALAAAEPAAAGETVAGTALVAGPAGKAAPGTALPIALRSGKILPVLSAATLAGAADEGGTEPVGHDGAESDPPATEAEATALPANAAHPVAVVAQLPLPQADPTVTSPAENAAPARRSSAHQFAAAIPPKAAPTAQGTPLPNPAPEQPPVAQGAAASVTVQVAPPAEAPAGDQTQARPAREPRAAKKNAAIAADSSIGAMSAKPEAPLPAPATVTNVPAASLANHLHDGGKASSPVAALHDLTSVVDRLVAAREAFAPVTAAMTVQHGELGDLSLRFDQHRDGHLAVQLSASDPDAHRAIVAAVSDAGFRSSADGQTGTSQQPTQSQAQARGHSAEREPGQPGNGSATRHDQPQQRRPASQAQQRPADDRRRAGVFA